MDEAIGLIEKQSDITIVTLSFKTFLHDDNSQFVKFFDQILQEGNKKVILDFSNTTYLSSMILASLVYVQKISQDMGGALVFCNLKDRVKEIVEMTHLDKVFDIVLTRDEAVNFISEKNKM